MFYAITNIVESGVNTNKTGHHVVIPDTPIKLVTMFTMFYAIPDTLLKVSLNTQKIGHDVEPIKLVTMFYVIPYIVESVV